VKRELGGIRVVNTPKNLSAARDDISLESSDFGEGSVESNLFPMLNNEDNNQVVDTVSTNTMKRFEEACILSSIPETSNDESPTAIRLVRVRVSIRFRVRVRRFLVRV
jgi:hypothetical protein